MKFLIIADPPLQHPCAMEKGAHIAAAMGAEIHVVGFAYDPVLEKPGPQKSNKHKNEIVASNKMRLEAQAKDNFPSSTTYSVESVWAKSIEDWIVKKTKAEQFHTIIKTGHRSESVFHTPLDWQLIRQNTVPLLITTASRWKAKPRVLATIDVESSHADQKKTNAKVLKRASELVEAFGGELHVATCKPVSKMAADLDLVQIRQVEEKNREKFLKKAEKLLSDQAISNATCHFSAGNVANVIHHMAKDLKVDLIVMGSVGRKKLKGLIIGSTAEELMQKSQNDILVIVPD